jgi:hypothetical protein
VVPIENPFPNAMIRKNTGNVAESAASARDPIFPAQNVSTTLNMVLKKNPIETGIAMVSICLRIYTFS